MEMSSIGRVSRKLCDAMFVDPCVDLIWLMRGQTGTTIGSKYFLFK